MATVDKNFKVKHGLVVEGTTATVNGDDIITATQAQTLSNKEFTGETKFHAANGAGTFKINLNSTTGATTLFGNNGNLDIVANGGDLILNADGTTYLGSATSGNEVATQSYVASQALSSTDALSEGSTNKYFTAQRAKDAAAALITGATKTNITITGDGNGLTITAENGVADSTTDDLTEGSTNLYFTEQRGRDAAKNALVAGPGLEFTNNMATGPVTIQAKVGQMDGAITTDSTEGYLKVKVDDSTIWTGGSANQLMVKTGPTSPVASKTFVNDLIGDPSVDGTSGNTVKDRIDTAVANLVDGAPALLNTLNELAAAINDDAGFSSTIATQIGGKQDALTAGDGISLGTGSTVSTKVDNLGIGINGSGQLEARAGAGLSATTTGLAVVHDDSLTIDGVTNALKVQLGYASGMSASGLTVDTNGLAVDTSLIADKGYVDTNFVNVADLPGQLGDYVPLTQKAAANGVATLDGLGQVPADQLGNVPSSYITGLKTGESNLSVTAGKLSLTSQPTFATTSYSGTKIESGTTTASSAGTSVHQFGIAVHDAAKYVVKSKNGSGDKEISELLVVVDGSGNIAITEYGNVATNASLTSITANRYSDGKGGYYVALEVTPVSGSVDVSVYATLFSI